MNRLGLLLNLRKMTFEQKVKAVFTANLVMNEEQASAVLSDLVYSEQTSSLHGSTALEILDYDDAKDWLQTLILTAISIEAQRREPAGLEIEALFYSAWIESGYTRALSDLIRLRLATENRDIPTESFKDKTAGDAPLSDGSEIPTLDDIGKLFIASTMYDDIRNLYRLALKNHIRAMLKQHSTLFVDSAFFKGHI